MKIAIFSDEISQDLTHACEVALEYDCHGIELRSAMNRNVCQWTLAEARQLRTVLGERGMTVCAIGSPFAKCDLDSASDVERHFTVLEHCCQLANLYETSLVRGFTYWRSGNVQARWPEIVEQYQHAGEIAGQYGCVLAVENEPSCHVGTGAQLGQFVRDVGLAQVRALWDPANVLTDTQFHEIPWPDGYACVRGLIAHVHIKDYGFDNNGVMAPAAYGEGMVDLRGQLKALRADGYEGWLSLETHWRPLQLTEQEISQPGGASFSTDGEFASRLYLERFKQMLEEIQTCA